MFPSNIVGLSKTIVKCVRENRAELGNLPAGETHCWVGRRFDCLVSPRCFYESITDLWDREALSPHSLLDNCGHAV